MPHITLSGYARETDRYNRILPLHKTKPILFENRTHSKEQAMSKTTMAIFSEIMKKQSQLHPEINYWTFDIDLGIPQNKELVLTGQDLFG